MDEKLIFDKTHQEKPWLESDNEWWLGCLGATRLARLDECKILLKDGGLSKFDRAILAMNIERLEADIAANPTEDVVPITRAQLILQPDDDEDDVEEPSILDLELP